MLVAKTGFGEIIVVDKDVYELPNIVEQLFAGKDTLGICKTEIAEDAVRQHGLFAEVNAINKNIQTEEDVIGILDNSDYVICCVDDPVARVTISRVARKLQIPFIIAANIGCKIVVSLYLPNDVSFEDDFYQVSRGKSLTEEIKQALYIQQKAYLVSFGDFTDNYIQKYLNEEISYISYLGIPAVFAAGVAVNEILKSVIGKGNLRVAPFGFAFDLLTMQEIDIKKVGVRTHYVMKSLLNNDVHGAIEILKKNPSSMSYSQKNKNAFRFFG